MYLYYIFFCAMHSIHDVVMVMMTTATVMMVATRTMMVMVMVMVTRTVTRTKMMTTRTMPVDRWCQLGGLPAPPAHVTQSDPGSTLHSMYYPH